MFFSPVVPSGDPSPFASATDLTVHRQPWRSSLATDHAACRPPRKLPSRSPELLQTELLRPPPASPARSPTARRRKTAADASSTRLGRPHEPENADELQWLQHRWLGKHGKASELKARRAQATLLRRWFESLDADGSGEVGLDELEDPLVSVGLARSRADVHELMARVDRDGSGEITFAEFLSMMHPPRRGSHQQQPQPALHEPKDRATTSSASSPGSPRGRQFPRAGSNAAAAALLEPPAPRRGLRPAPPEREEPNPVAKLFHDLQSGRLGDLAVPFPVLITAYRRRMLLNAHMAEDPAARGLGAAVLRALESSRRASTLPGSPGSLARRQSLVRSSPPPPL